MNNSPDKRKKAKDVKVKSRAGKGKKKGAAGKEVTGIAGVEPRTQSYEKPVKQRKSSIEVRDLG